METLRQTIVDRRVTKKTIFNATTLTSAYQSSETLEVCGSSKGALAIEYERGEEEVSSVLVAKIEFSHDGTNWFQEASATSPHNVLTHTLDPDQDSGMSLVVQFDVASVGYMRVSVKETSVMSEYGNVTMVASWMP